MKKMKRYPLDSMDDIKQWIKENNVDNISVLRNECEDIIKLCKDKENKMYDMNKTGGEE